MANPNPEVDPIPSDVLEVDSTSDHDSAFSDQGESAITSLSPSVTDYRYENGRRYHSYGDGKYLLPNDEQESDRMDLKHEMFSIMFDGKLHFAPIGENPQRILDIGTGTGIWAIDMANKYPSAMVIGNDLSPIQPSWVPPNVYFEIDDMQLPWIYSTPFDYIHGRYMNGSFADWPHIIGEAYKHLKPGGWIEFQEIYSVPNSDDGTLTSTSPFKQWTTHLITAAAASGKPLTIAPNLQSWFQSAGFQDVHVQIFKNPINPWPKDKKMKKLGQYHQAAIEEGLGALSLFLFTRYLGWEKERIEEFLREVLKDVRDKKVHAYFPNYVVYGRKPEKNESV